MTMSAASLDATVDRRVALVTGAAGDIGREIVAELARSGWVVALAGRRRDALQALADSLPTKDVPHAVLAFDLTDEVACAEAIDRTVATFGRLDCLVNNAATWFDEGFLETSDDHWRTVFEVNVVAAARLARLAAPALACAPSPRVVNVSSKSAYAVEAELGSYGVSKAALNALTKVMASELGPQGVSVIGIAPGFIDTPSNHRVLDDPALSADRRSRIPVGRFGTAEEVARVVGFFCGDGGAFVTGTTVLMDGGQLAWH